MDENKNVDTQTTPENDQNSMDYSFDFSNQVSTETPAEPEVPAEPAAPVEPVEAPVAEPEVPAEPAAPVEPVEAPVAEPEVPAEPVTPVEPVEAPVAEQAQPAEPATKSGKSTIIFGVALLVLIVAFIIALPYLRNLG